MSVLKGPRRVERAGELPRDLQRQDSQHFISGRRHRDVGPTVGRKLCS
jgi:hypothetical protein